MNQPRMFDDARSGGAIISECGLYRYELTRSWDREPRYAAFLMLNPSTADATRSDPTMTRCLDYARAWGYDGLAIVNLFAFRATDPEALKSAADPVGPENDRYIREWADRAELLVCAWGAHPFAARRVADVLRIIREAGATPHRLTLTKDGHPGHPLMLPKRLTPVPMEVAS